MRKIFLDCGAWDGYSVKVFRQVYDPKCEYEIHSFEANPIHLENFPVFKKHTIHAKAVWVKDEERYFYLDSSKKRAGSTLMKSKTKAGYGKFIGDPIKVQCIDIDEFVKSSFNVNDFIIIKLDIEGAEYKVLQHMIQNGSIDYMNKLFIEWHWNKIGISKAVHSDLIKQIKIPIVERWKVGYKR